MVQIASNLNPRWRKYWAQIWSEWIRIILCLNLTILQRLPHKKWTYQHMYLFFKYRLENSSWKLWLGWIFPVKNLKILPTMLTYSGMSVMKHFGIMTIILLSKSMYKFRIIAGSMLFRSKMNACFAMSMDII